MLKTWKPFLSLFIFLVLSVNPLFAAESDVVINELMPNPVSGEKDWVELYNLSTKPTDISGWILKDSTSEIYNIKEATISGQGFVVFKVSDRLNKSVDTVYLLRNEQEMSSCGYSEYYGDDVSIGRYPDGYGDCAVLDSVSRESNNSLPIPTSTPIPIPTSIPTKIPTPTKSPTPEPAKTVAPTPTLTVDNTAIPTKHSSKIGRVVNLFLPTSIPTSLSAEKDVLGEATDEAEAFKMDLGGVFMSLGGIFVIGAGMYVAKKESER